MQSLCSVQLHLSAIWSMCQRSRSSAIAAAALITYKLSIVIHLYDILELFSLDLSPNKLIT
ncbi:hypothetical protein QTP88_020035 [Uroleucon formosanum]